MHLKKIAPIIIVVILTIYFYSGQNHLKQKVDQYNGDGQITFYKAPFGGVDGYEIKMAPFLFKNRYEHVYKIDSIPNARDNLVYIVVPRGTSIESILDCEITFELLRGESVVQRAHSTFRNMKNTIGQGQNRFHFNDRGSFTINDPNGSWRIKIILENKTPTNGVEIYLLISHGGVK
jgi:hypothetical protein